MDREQIKSLLADTVSKFQFVDKDSGSVDSWYDALDKDMRLEFAKQVVADHYGNPNLTTEKVMPGHLNRAWRQHRQAERHRLDALHYTEAACPFTGCTCSHSDGCYKGWIDGDGSGPTSPCPRCRPSLHTVLGEVNALGHRTSADESRIINRFRDNATP